MDMELELVFVPVTDIDRAKSFYMEQVGFVADFDPGVSADEWPNVRAVGSSGRTGAGRCVANAHAGWEFGP